MEFRAYFCGDILAEVLDAAEVDTARFGLTECLGLVFFKAVGEAYVHCWAEDKLTLDVVLVNKRSNPDVSHRFSTTPKTDLFNVIASDSRIFLACSGPCNWENEVKPRKASGRQCPPFLPEAPEHTSRASRMTTEAGRLGEDSRLWAVTAPVVS